MVFNRLQAAERAEASRTNQVGYCQAWTTQIFGVPPVGDYDHDGDADAVDGWKADLAKGHAHPGNYNPPRGVPVSWGGGRNGHGHRAISLGGGLIRSTDAGGPGRVATVRLDWPNRNWGLTYLGWSETINGVYIPVPAPAPAPKPQRYTVDQLAHQVIAGQWGVNPQRAVRLRAAGYDPNAVQARVNQILA